MSIIETGRENLLVNAGSNQPRQPNSSPIPMTKVCITKCKTSKPQLSERMLKSLSIDKPPNKNEINVIAEAIIGKITYQPTSCFFGASFCNKFWTPVRPLVR